MKNKIKLLIITQNVLKKQRSTATIFIYLNNQIIIFAEGI